MKCTNALASSGPYVAPEQRLEGLRDLRARQKYADAPVQPVAEHHQLVPRAIGIELLRLDDATLVEHGRLRARQDPGAGGDPLLAGAPRGDRVVGDALAERTEIDGLEAQRLVETPPETLVVVVPRRLLCTRLEILPAQEHLEHVARRDRVGRHETGQHAQELGANQLVTGRAATLPLHLNQAGDDGCVAGRRLFRVADRLIDRRAHAVRSLACHGEVRARLVRRGCKDVRADRGEPVGEQLRVREVDAVILPAQQGRDTGHEPFDRVDPAAAPRDDPLGEHGGAGRDRPRDIIEPERMHDLPALLPVVGAVLHRQHEQGSGHQLHHPGGERHLKHLVLVQHLPHVLESRHHGKAEVRNVEDRPASAEEPHPPLGLGE